MCVTLRVVLLTYNLESPKLVWGKNRNAAQLSMMDTSVHAENWKRYHSSPRQKNLCFAPPSFQSNPKSIKACPTKFGSSKRLLHQISKLGTHVCCMSRSCLSSLSMVKCSAILPSN